ncbi:hypothetical protein M0802_015388 [Mischocyttarus mexicanus]|nr:hypothetical protein M0802_015388 [Mischocyttarus mexicanus]
MNVVVESKDRDLLNPFVDSGWFLDLRKRDFVSFHDFERSLMHELVSLQRRIKYCNQLRATLMETCQLAYRYCGPELETLMHPVMAAQGSEHVGLFSLGTYVTFDGEVSRNTYALKSDDVAFAFIRISNDPELDDGQRKLYSLMYGFALNREIVYVGASPGIGWAKAVRDLSYENTVYDFDPRELDASVLEILNDRVEFHCHRVVHPEDVLDVVPPSSPFDLIWDARGDWTNDDSYDRMVRNEIAILTNCLDGWRHLCRRVCFKFAPR